MPRKVMSETETLFVKLRDGDYLLSVGQILDKLIRLGNDDTHLRLIKEFGQKLDLGWGAGWFSLARYGSEKIHMMLMNDHPDKLEREGSEPVPDGWTLMAMYGSPDVKREVELRKGIVRE